MEINEMLQKRAKCVSDARAIFDLATEEGRDPTAEERQQFDLYMKEADELKASAEIAQADQKRKDALDTAANDLARPMDRVGDMQTRGDEPKDQTFKFSDGRTAVLNKATTARDYVNAFSRMLCGHSIPQNALQADNDPSGGYTVPAMFNAQLIQAVDDLVFIRQKATKFTLMTGESLGFPSLDNDPADSDWTVELAVGSEDSTMSFGKREFKPYPLAKLIKVSKKLIRSSAIDVVSLVRERLAYKFGVSEEKGFLTGSGAGQPLGLFTASSDGISTSRDISTDNTTTAITFDGLKNAEYALKASYRSKAEWLFHRDAMKMISKLKDGDGRYLWQPSTQVSSPDMLLGRPYNESEFAPNTFTTGLYVGMLGDFSKYWIVDALTMTVQVLLELYAATNQNGYIGRLECDGMPVLEEAFARVTLG